MGKKFLFIMLFVVHYFFIFPDILRSRRGKSSAENSSRMFSFCIFSVQTGEGKAVWL